MEFNEQKSSYWLKKAENSIAASNQISRVRSFEYRSSIKIVSPSANPAYGERIRGYQLALMEHGIPLRRSIK